MSVIASSVLALALDHILEAALLLVKHMVEVEIHLPTSYLLLSRLRFSLDHIRKRAFHFAKVPDTGGQEDGGQKNRSY